MNINTLNYYFDGGSESSYKNNNKKYINLNYNTFDINKFSIKRDKKEGKWLNTFSCEYNNCNFYIFPIKAFNSYGIQHKNNNDMNEVEYSYSISKVSLIFNDNYKYHVFYKVLITDIYKYIQNYVKNTKLKVYNPINGHNTMNCEINDRTLIYEYKPKTQSIDILPYEDLLKRKYYPFIITPVIYFKKFNVKDNILYFNTCIKTCTIQFIEFPMDFDQIVFAHNLTNDEEDSINNINTENDNNENITDDEFSGFN